MDYLPENVFELAKQKPTKDDADSEGRVLYYHPKLGWMSGVWMYTLHSNVTHWTYCPETPDVKSQSPEELQQQAFEEWAQSFEIELNAPTKAFANLVWRAACKKLEGKPY